MVSWFGYKARQARLRWFGPKGDKSSKERPRKEIMDIMQEKKNKLVGMREEIKDRLE